MIPITLLLIIDHTMFLTALPVYITWFLMMYCLFWNIAPRFWVKTRKRVIDYIKGNLLK